MDLEELNTSYTKAKGKLEDKKKNIEKYEEKIKILTEDIKIAIGERIKAERKNNLVKKDNIQKEIKSKKEEIEKIKKSIEEEKEEMEMFQEKIDTVIEKIKENPEIQKHLEQVLAKRYAREIKKIDKEKEQEEKNKEKVVTKIYNLEEVRKLIQEHPTMKNHIQGMLNANYNIQELNKKLSELDPIKDKTKVENINKELVLRNDKLNKNRDEILAYANKNKLKITKETLQQIMDNSVIDKKANCFNIEASINEAEAKLEREIKAYDKKISGYNKQITNNRAAILKLGYTVPEKEETIKDDDTNKTKDKKDEIIKIENSLNIEEKPKWWQFIKRFNQWKEKRDIPKLPSPEEKVSNGQEKFEFANSLKYEVIEDIAREMQKQKVREAKQEIKAASKSQKEEKEELEK